MTILVTGPQGSGKTTQAKLLAEYLKVPFIGMGEVLRQRMERNDEIGRKIKEVMEKGELVDDQIVADFTKEKVMSPACQNGFVMDGYPRSIHQAGLFNPNFNKVFYLDIPEIQVLERLLKRGRADDKPDLIKERLQIYHQETEPLLDLYKNQGILKIVDGLKSIDEVQREIRKSLND